MNLKSMKIGCVLNKDSKGGEVSSILKTASRTSRANSLKVNKHKNYFILVIVWMIVVQSVNIIV